ncbi:DUF5808 domain-containing protein [Ureibacillus sp. FSL K6-8385]|uniref:DUF1648 domain-containing protein n=1 Tax=Ureibacillus sp. FSL K6-8385 TaxID=2954684 RepID=UPI0031591400
MAFMISLIILLFLSTIQSVMPYFVKRTVVFGVSVPEQHIQDERIRAYKKQYTMLTIAVSFFMILIYSAWAAFKQPSDEAVIFIGTIIEFIIIFISLALFYYYRGKMKQYKRAEKWAQQLKQVAAADLTVHSEDSLPPWYIYLLPMIVTAGLMGYTIYQYDLLPQQIPTHWGLSGEPDAFTEKTPFTAIQMLLFLLLLQLMFLGIQLGMKFSGIKLSATNLSASKNRQLALRKSPSWFSFYTVLLITMLFSYFQLTTIHPDLFNYSLLKALIPFGVMFLILAGTAILMVIVGRSDKYPSESMEEGLMDASDDKYWKAGLFYFNKNDPSIFVEKRFGVGWTINFANPVGYLIIFGPLILILLIAFLFQW